MATDVEIGNIVRKAIILNILKLTKKKQKLLKRFVNEYLSVSNKHLLELPFADTTTDLHHLTYDSIRQTSFLPSDIVQEARKDAWKIKPHMIHSGYNGIFSFKHSSIRLNQRWFRYIMSNRGNPCFKITYSPRKTFTLPVKLDKQFERFTSFLNAGWQFNNVSLLHDGRIAVVLDKQFEQPENDKRFVIGIDINSPCVALAVFDTVSSKVVKQLYLGQNIAPKQKLFTERRSKLQELADNNSERAKKSLKQLRSKQSNFTKTRCGQVASGVINIALQYDASVCIEKLKKLKAEKGEKNKKARKKINRIPYKLLKDFLQRNCEEQNIPFNIVDAYHTSKWCTHCGAVNNGHHSSNYSLYKCKQCNQIVNSDRKASLAVAVKSVLERKSHDITNSAFVQISNTQVPVNGLLRPDDKVSADVVHLRSPLMESHRF